VHVTSLTNYHPGIGIRWTHCNGSFIIHTLPAQIVIIDDLSLRKAIGVHILLRVSSLLISVTTLWDMIIPLCICKGYTGRTKLLDSKLSWLTIDQRDIVLPLTDKWESAIEIGVKIDKWNFSQWWRTSHRGSGRCAGWICKNDHHHVACIHTSNYITLLSDLVHIFNILKIAYSRSRKSRRRNCIGQSEKVGLY